MKSLLITGGAGFIGSNFIRHMLETEPHIKIINLDALTYAGSLQNINDIMHNEHHVFVHGNICDSSLVENLVLDHHIDTIVHFAAETHVDRSIHYPKNFIQTNIMGTFTLLEASRKTWKKGIEYESTKVRFHHISTDEVYGSLQPDDPAFTENTSYQPNSPYSATKAGSDHLVRAYHHTYHLPITISNCSNNYGPFQFPEKFIPLVIMNCINGRPIPVYGDGKQIRDWLHVSDHCEAIRLILKNGEIGETYNIGGGNQPCNYEIVEIICEIMDREFPDSNYRPHNNLIKYITDRPGHDRRYAMDHTKITHEIGWEPKVGLREGLEKTVGWYINNPGWIKSICEEKNIDVWLQKNYDNRDME